MRRIEVLSFADVQLLDVAGPLQVFATANDLAVQAGRQRPYDPVAIAVGDRIATSSGLSIATVPLPPAEAEVDTLIVAGGWGVDAACKNDDLVEWVRQRAGIARRTASVCSGAFLLATAGLLDGRRAATHWQRCDEFAGRFPKVRLDPDPIFIQDGDIWTSAGVTAGIDLALAMVELDLGRDAALGIARQLVVFLKRPGGQAQFSATLDLQDGDNRFDRLHAWMLDHMDRPLTLDVLAEQARMSTRSFSRHYRKTTGRTPAKAVEEVRLEAARRQLEGGASVQQVSRRCGFGSEETMRRVFQKRFGTSPQAYRDLFSRSAADSMPVAGM